MNDFFDSNRRWIFSLVSTVIGATAPIMLAILQASSADTQPNVPPVMLMLSQAVLILGSFTTALQARLTDTVAARIVSLVMVSAGLLFLAIVIFRLL